MKQFWKLVIAALRILLITAVCLVGFYATCFGKLDWREYQVRRAAHYEGCATNLALYCQTFGPFLTLYPFSDNLIGQLSLPACVGFLDRYHGSFGGSPDGDEMYLQVRYGAGFEDYGYRLKLVSRDQQGFSLWRLNYYIESHERTLREFSVPSKSRFPITGFQPGAAQYHLTNSIDESDPVYSSMTHIRFLLMTGHPQASNYLANVVNKFPNAEEPTVALAAFLAAYDLRDEAIRLLTGFRERQKDINASYWVEQFRRELGATNIGPGTMKEPRGSYSRQVDYPRLIEAIRRARQP